MHFQMAALSGAERSTGVDLSMFVFTVGCGLGSAFEELLLPCSFPSSLPPFICSPGKSVPEFQEG